MSKEDDQVGDDAHLHRTDSFVGDRVALWETLVSKPLKDPGQPLKESPSNLAKKTKKVASEPEPEPKPKPTPPPAPEPAAKTAPTPRWKRRSRKFHLQSREYHQGNRARTTTLLDS